MRHVPTDRLPGRREAGPEADEWRLSDGEVHYLWWYIQGSIMEPSVRRRLHRAWGSCGRHAWGALAVDTAFRPDFLHGPALLYQDLMLAGAAAGSPGSRCCGSEAQAGNRRDEKPGAQTDR